MRRYVSTVIAVFILVATFGAMGTNAESAREAAQKHLAAAKKAAGYEVFRPL